MTFSNFSTPHPAANRYFQYRAILESDDTSTNCNYGSGATWCSPQLQSVTVGPGHFDSSSPTVVTKNGINFYSLSAAIETLGSGGCNNGGSSDAVVYNLGNGTTVGTGTVYLKAFLQSSGTSACQLSAFQFNGLN
jgi:hypothetical protein